METTQTQTEHPTFESVWAMMQENARQLEIDRKKTERVMRNLNKQMGDLHNRFGEMAEHLVVPGIADRFNELGYHFNDISPGGRKILDEQKKVKAQIDILLENGDSIVAVEVKAKVLLKDVEQHVRRLEILREHRSKLNDRRTIHGAIAGAIFGEVEKKATIEAGMYVLEQSGDTMKLEIPDDFVPRDW